MPNLSVRRLDKVTYEQLGLRAKLPAKYSNTVLVKKMVSTDCRDCDDKKSNSCDSKWS